jgi:2-keto-3-deoxy-galactonokinase
MIGRWLCAAGLALLCAVLSRPSAAQNINTNALITMSAQGAATLNSPDQPNQFFRGVVVGVNLTAMATATVTVHVQGKDIVSGQYYDILVSTALAATGFTPLTVYPGAAATANSSAPSPLPPIWRVEAVVTGTASGTIEAALIQ